MSATSPQDLKILMPNGIECAARIYGDESAPPILALHGWLDNCATYKVLAPLLPNYRIVALDFPGHGRSARRPLSAPYYLWSYVSEIRAVVEHFGWQEFTLLGHSMGGAVGCLYAALYPVELKRMVLLDILGPISTEPEKLPAQMREALGQLQSAAARARHYYPDLQAAIQARADKGLSRSAAEAFAERGVVCDEQGCYWDMDPRLRVLSVMSLSESQVEAFLREIRCPVLAILSTEFWATRQAMLEARKPLFTTASIIQIEGSHHQHMEEQADEIAAMIRKFLS